MSHKDFSIALGKRLRDARNRSLLYQDELAKRAGLHVCQISFIETGTRLPSVDKLRKLATALGVSIDELVPVA